MIERMFENSLWASRFIVLLAVVFGLVGAMILFVVASVDIYQSALYIINTYLTHAHPDNFHENVVGAIIGAVDFYLIGVVMLIFSFGLFVKTKTTPSTQYFGSAHNISTNGHPLIENNL